MSLVRAPPASSVLPEPTDVSQLPGSQPPASRVDIYNFNLPLDHDRLEAEAEERFRAIVGLLAEAALAPSSRSIGAACRSVNQYLNLKYLISPTERARIITLLHEVLVYPGLDSATQSAVATLLLRLLKKSSSLAPGLLQPLRLVLPWRPLFEHLRRSFFPPTRVAYHLASEKHLKRILDYLSVARLYFDSADTDEIKEMALSMFSPDSAQFCLGLGFFSRFVPIRNAPASQVLGWLARVPELWNLVANMPSWDATWIDLVGWVAQEHTVGGIILDPETVSLATDPIRQQLHAFEPQLLATAISLFSVPVGSRAAGIGGGRLVDVFSWSSANDSLQPSDQAAFFSLAHYFAFSLGPDPAVDPSARSLEELFRALEPFMHPSNTGRWSARVMMFAASLVYYLGLRIRIETRPMPGSRRLTPHMRLSQATLEFVCRLVQPMMLLQLFSKDSYCVRDSIMTMSKLCTMCPEIALPPFLETIATALDSVLEAHRTYSALYALIHVAPVLVNRAGHTSRLGVFAEPGPPGPDGQPTASTKPLPFNWRPRPYFQGPGQVFDLLHAVLPGIDMNDPSKTFRSLYFVYVVLLFMPIVNSSATSSTESAPQYTESVFEGPVNQSSLAEEQVDLLIEADRVVRDATGPGVLGEWCHSFLEQVFRLLDNLPEDSSKGINVESSVVSMVVISTGQFFRQLSPEYFAQALRQFVAYIGNSSAPLGARNAVGMICSSLTWANPEAAMRALVPLCLARIRDEVNSLPVVSSLRGSGPGASSASLGEVSEASDLQLQWYLNILYHLFHRTDPGTILLFKEELREAIELCLVTTRRGSYKMTCKLVRHLLAALTATGTLAELRSVTPDLWAAQNLADIAPNLWGDSFASIGLPTDYQSTDTMDDPRPLFDVASLHLDVKLTWRTPTPESLDWACTLMTELIEPRAEHLKSLLEQPVLNWQEITRQLIFLRHAVLGLPLQDISYRDIVEAFARGDLDDESPPGPGDPALSFADDDAAACDEEEGEDGDSGAGSGDGSDVEADSVDELTPDMTSPHMRYLRRAPLLIPEAIPPGHEFLPKMRALHEGLVALGARLIETTESRQDFNIKAYKYFCKLLAALICLCSPRRLILDWSVLSPRLSKTGLSLKIGDSKIRNRSNFASRTEALLALRRNIALSAWKLPDNLLAIIQQILTAAVKNPYAVLRSYFQLLLRVIFKIFPRQRLLSLNRVFQILETEGANNITALKGGLYTIKKTGMLSFCLRSWKFQARFMNYFSSARFDEKLSVQNLSVELFNNFNESFYFISLGVAPTSRGLALAQKLQLDFEGKATPVPAKQHSFEADRRVYQNLVSSLSECLVGPVNWNTQNNAAESLAMCVRADATFGNNLSDWFYRALSSDHPSARSLAIDLVSLVLYSAKPHARQPLPVVDDIRVLVDPLALSAEEIQALPAKFELDLSSHLKTDACHAELTRRFIAQSTTSTELFVDTLSHGWLRWPKRVRVYNGTHSRESVSTHSNLAALAALVNAPNFWDDLLGLLQIGRTFDDEDDGGAGAGSGTTAAGEANFDSAVYVLLKSLFRHFGLSAWLGALGPLRRLAVQTNDRAAQSLSCELVAGVLRGSRAWGTADRETLRRTLRPLLAKVFDSLNHDNVADWGSAISYGMSHQDPRRVRWLIDLILSEKLQTTRRYSFSEARKVQLQLNLFSAMAWRLVRFAAPTAKALLPHMAHPYRQCRDQLGSIMHILQNVCIIPSLPREEWVRFEVGSIMARALEHLRQLIPSASAPGTPMVLALDAPGATDDVDAAAAAAAAGATDTAAVCARLNNDTLAGVGSLTDGDPDSILLVVADEAFFPSAEAAAQATILLDRDVDMTDGLEEDEEDVDGGPEAADGAMDIESGDEAGTDSEADDGHHGVDEEDDAGDDDDDEDDGDDGDEEGHGATSEADAEVEADAEAALDAGFSGGAGSRSLSSLVRHPGSPSHSDPYHWLAKTSLIYAFSGMNLLTARGVIPTLLELLPSFLNLLEDQDRETQRMTTLVLAHLTQLQFSSDKQASDVARIIIECLQREGVSWHIYFRTVPILQIFLYRHMFRIDKEVLKQATHLITTVLLRHAQVEVRTAASEALSGLIRCGLVAASPEALHRRFAKLARSSPVATALVDRHAGVLGLCAMVLSSPYSIPDWMPAVLMDLAGHSRDPQPIGQSVSATMSDFRRTHNDSWHLDRTRFTSDQLAVLTDLLVSPSYYA